MRITFCYPVDDLDAARRLEPDRDWIRFQQGEEAWILATYLRLAAAGAPVELATLPPDEGLVILHAKHKRILAAALARLRHAVVVLVRGDLRGSLAGADFEIVQNAASADARRRQFVPHWPQPGLVARDPERGERFERLAFKGYLANLHPDLQGAPWRDFLADRGIDWQCDAVRFAGAGTDRTALQWPDYREVDAVLAVRPPRVDVAGKPAAKLYNAWLAGVPALLGPEPAFRELRRSPLDYLEIGSAAEARDAVLRLQSEPGLHRAMVAHGRERGAEYSTAATLRAWRRLLEETLPALASRPRAALRRRLLRYADRIRFALAGASPPSR